MNVSSLTAALKTEANRLGFDLVGISPAVTPQGIDNFGKWLEAGYAGQMHYLPERAAAYEHPKHILDGVRSLLMLAMNYRTSEPARAEAGQGRVSRYAWGPTDYHDLIRDRLHRLSDYLRKQHPAALTRGVVDTAPLLEREFAQLAGLGWIGKNTLLLNRDAGSWFFLAALLTDVTLEYDQPHQTDHCGTCRACLDACPTDAFPAPYVLDATRCISYLTIELREQIPIELREGIGNWLFGCDICQEVCPWNNHAEPTDEPSFFPQQGMNLVELDELFELDDAAFRHRFRQTPLWRSKRRGLLRNAAIVLGNRPNNQTCRTLTTGLDDAEPLVRAACAWALGKLNVPQSKAALRERLEIETDNVVRCEIETAIGQD